MFKIVGYILASFLLLSTVPMATFAQKTDPSVTVNDQALKNGTVTVAGVVSDGPGWIVIHIQADDAPGPVIGQSVVTDGENANIIVDIDSEQATETLYAMLHTDAGTVGTYEFPGDDGPVIVDGQPVAPAFTLTADTGKAADNSKTTDSSKTTDDSETVDDNKAADDSLMSASETCVQDYTIQRGDWLSLIAVELLGSGGAYTAIIEATNAAAESDDTYNTITNPGLIEPGWVLCIPNVEGIQTTTASPTTSDSGSVDESTTETTTTDNSVADDSTTAASAPSATDDRATEENTLEDAPTGGMMMGNTLLVTANPADLADDQLVGLSLDLDATQAIFNNFSRITSIQSAQYGADGTAYLTANMADDAGAIMVIESLMSSEAQIGTGSRLIAGTNTGLVAPKGLYVVDSLGLILVADFGAKDIKVFSTDATGNAAPLFAVTNLGSDRSLWDIHHDIKTDTLFVAGTDGAFLAYDNFLVDQGAGGPNRVVTPVNDFGGKISVNLHGIYYVSGSDILFISDIGDANVTNDGQIFGIINALTVRDTAPTETQISGSNTQLGNPVDLDFDGTHLYVAEKSNDKVLRFDKILEKRGRLNITAEYSTPVTKAESVSVIK